VKIAELLDCSLDQISVKATTSEKMGFVGRGEGVAAYSTVLVQRK
jgi:2-C-methyl-D-erythritol 2,4-cyclodiphosphate synthase